MSTMVEVPQGKHLLDFGNRTELWSEAEVDRLASRPGVKGNFMDISDYQTPPKLQSSSSSSAIPDEPVHQDLVEGYLNQLNVRGVEASITHLSTAYRTRYYTTTTGRDAVMWLKEQYENAAGSRTDVAIEIFEHTWLQPSLIVTIEGKGNNRAETVVLGGHIDSTAGSANSLAPGADDDASGSAAALEVFRTLMLNQFVPDRTVEFHAYAAEEVGLRGSQAIAQEYSNVGRNVVSMVQFDMCGYPANTNTPIGLTEDYVDSRLTAFVGKLIDTYSALPWEPSVCGYACSDHASWTRVNVPSSFPFECKMQNINPNIHTASDTIDKISVPRCNEFVKYGVGYVVEMALISL
jgi:leucyl aminopeptidase